jgi:hypothetical protein
MIQHPTSVVRSLTGLQLSAAGDWPADWLHSETVVNNRVSPANVPRETRRFWFGGFADRQTWQWRREPIIVVKLPE